MSDQESILHNELRATFDSVREWLLFAEAKNAALLTFDVAILVGIWSALAQLDNPSQKLLVYSGLTSILLLISALFPMLAFLPKLKFIGHRLGTPGSVRKEYNIHYFGHIAQQFPEQYLKIYADSLNLSI